MEKGAALLAGGLLFLGLAAVVSRPSVPHAGINDLAAVLAVAGAAAAVWGVVILKKQKQERQRRRRRNQ